MKLKYYLRGLGIGIIVTTLILAVSGSVETEQLSDDEIIARATKLGMFMPGENTEQMEETELTEAGEENGRTESGDGTEQSDGIGAFDDEVQTNGSEAVEEGEQSEKTQSRESFWLMVRQGDAGEIICEALALNGVIDDANAFEQYLMEEGYATSIRVGLYEIPYGLSYEEIATILRAGPQRNQ